MNEHARVTFLCPMRDPSTAGCLPKEDHWEQQNGETRCSYCGSLRPDVFMARVTGGAQLIPTERSDKTYLRRGGGSASGQSRFYWAHLSEEHKRMFISMVDAGQVTFAKPGHFLAYPYFMRKPI